MQQRHRQKYKISKAQAAILSLYSNPTARLLTEGTLSKSFGIPNSTRQSCPLSPLSFALLMEPLASKIRNDPRISGIPCNGIDNKISLFTDDIILMISNPILSLPAIQEILHQYSSVSFYKLNSTKSLILLLQLPPRQQSLLQENLPYT